MPAQMQINTNAGGERVNRVMSSEFLANLNMISMYHKLKQQNYINKDGNNFLRQKFLSYLIIETDKPLNKK